MLKMKYRSVYETLLCGPVTAVEFTNRSVSFDLRSCPLLRIRGQRVRGVRLPTLPSTSTPVYLPTLGGKISC